jgi:hypothetical protein
MIPRSLVVAVVVAMLATNVAGRQQTGQGPGKADAHANDISGMYSFLRDGEFVQITVEDGQVSGYVSRFGDSDTDKGQFIDQFFDKASLSGDRLSFKTKTVHGVWYEFSGVVATTPGKQPAQEGYWVIKGTLIQHAVDASGADKPRQRTMEMKSFPQDLSKP